MDFHVLLPFIASFFYATACGVVISRLFSPAGPNNKIIYSSVIVASAAQAIFLFSSVFTEQGQNLSLINMALFSSLIIVITVTMASIKFSVTLLMPAIYGFSALLLLISGFIPEHIMMQQLSQNTMLVSHISLSFLAYCALIIATLYAIQYQYINHKLKTRDMSIVFSHLPPLMQVEKQQFSLLVGGNVLLTIALISGFLFLNDMFAKEIAHKTVLSLLAWVTFTAVIVGHHFRNWRGKTTVTGTIIGAFILTLAYFGSRFIREFIIQ